MKLTLFLVLTVFLAVSVSAVQVCMKSRNLDRYCACRVGLNQRDCKGCCCHHKNICEDVVRSASPEYWKMMYPVNSITGELKCKKSQHMRG